MIGGAALAFVAAGLVPVAASDGHWPVTRVLLNFAMRRSVQTHALAVKPPTPAEQPLDGPALVLKGAGHYAEGCLPCHGAPGHPRAEVVLHAVPRPPYLPPMVAAWNDRELFWIVKHGIKYTAMPAWPSQQRDDEAWAMVAFLRRLPALAPDQFRQLAYGAEAEVAATGPAPPSGAPPDLATCARCHGRDGAGRGDGAFPPLAGQSEAYLLASLQAYARGARQSGVMQPVAAALGPTAMAGLARHYAAAPPGVRNAGGGRRDGVARAAIARGRALARDGAAGRRVASCVECHGPGPAPRNPRYPRLAGLPAAYLELQLGLFQRGQRGGGSYAGIMATVAARL